MRTALAVVLGVVLLSTVACGGQQSEAPEEPEKQGEAQIKTNADVPAEGEPAPIAEETTEFAGEMAPTGIVGEAIETPQFDLRVLDIFATDEYYYLESPYLGPTEGFSQAGRFLVINYSVTNTQAQNVQPNLAGTLLVDSAGREETYEETDAVAHPFSAFGGLDLAPREVKTGQWIFDVPTDAEPTTLNVLYKNDIEEPVGEAATIDLTDTDSEGPGPEEILALQYEYYNMEAWEQAYELFDEGSRQQVSLEQFAGFQEAQPVSVITDYAFPSVEIDGESATIERVLTSETADGEYEDKQTQEAIKDSEGWHLIMRPDQIELFTSPLEETTG